MLKDLDKRVRVDLHLHTTLSDGAFGPDEVLERCATSGLDVVALTDHDLATTVRPGVHELAGRRLHVIAGAEMSGVHDGREFHLLVYFPGEVPTDFRQFCAQQCIERASRYQQAVAALEIPGLPAPDPEALTGRRSVTRLHLARALYEQGHVGSVAEAFSRWLGSRGGIVPHFHYELVDAIRMARACGGITSWAHPSMADVEAYLPELVKAGLNGIEALRPALNSRDRARMRKLAGRHGIFLTGGSDWHGWTGERLGLFALSRQDIGDFVDALEAA